MKKYLFALLIVLSFSINANADNDESVSFDNTEATTITELAVRALLNTKALAKPIKVDGVMTANGCTSGTGIDTYGVLKDRDGQWWASPSQRRQQEGAESFKISYAMAVLMCSMME